MLVVANEQASACSIVDRHEGSQNSKAGVQKSPEACDKPRACAGLGAVEPGQGLTFLSAMLHSSSKTPPQPSQFLSSHFVHSPFIFHRLIAATGRSARFYGFLSASEASKFDQTMPDASAMSSATAKSLSSFTQVAISTSQPARDLAGDLSRIVEMILGQNIPPAQPLMEVSVSPVS